MYLKEAQQSSYAELDVSASVSSGELPHSGKPPSRLWKFSPISGEDTSSESRNKAEQENAPTKGTNESAESTENGPTSDAAETEREESAEALRVDTVTVARNEFLTEQEKFMEGLDGERRHQVEKTLVMCKRAKPDFGTDKRNLWRGPSVQEKTL